MGARYQAGQSVRYARTLDGGETQEAVVTKVGRKWGHIGEGYNGLRFNLETGELEGRWRHGWVFPTQADYDEACRQKKEEREMHALWEKVRRTVGAFWRLPEHLTRDDLETLRALLRIE